MTQKAFYTAREESWNTWSHTAGILLGIVCAIFFLRHTILTHQPWATFGVTLYMLGMLSCYISSTVYHALPLSSAWKQTTRKLDHAAIYWHIAGSYAPITLVPLRNEGFWGWGLFCFVWLCAIVGTCFAFRKLKDHSNFETITFVGMGLAVLVAFKPLLNSVDFSIVAWIIAEGVMYITGAMFYSLHKQRYMHTVFHFFVLAGSVCHLVAVWKIISI